MPTARSRIGSIKVPANAQREIASDLDLWHQLPKTIRPI